MSQQYQAADIEVLSGLEPVRRRPGMYTDTTRPNHLVQEVIDNSVDEAIAGYASYIEVILAKDGSIIVIDDGRGMPVDIHPEEKVPGVELILTKLHAGGKFSNKNYQFSGGLHGVGVSVVNALSNQLSVTVWRDAQEHYIEFANGEKKQDLTVLGSVAKKKTGTKVQFWPDENFFDSIKISMPKLTQLLRAKAVLCPGLKISLYVEAADHKIEWYYADGLSDYLLDRVGEEVLLPKEPIIERFSDDEQAAEWALAWLPEGELIQESYVNLIPTIQGGTHVNGFRSGLTDALREFCEIRNLLPRGIKFTPEDVWDRIAFILSVRMLDPQFSGQTKERLSSRSCAPYVAGLAKDSFSLWLNKHVSIAEAIAEVVIEKAKQRQKASKKVVRKKAITGPALPGKLADCSSQETEYTELFLVEGDSAGGSAKQARNKENQAILPLRGKILNTWEVESSMVLNSQEVHDISVAIGVDPASRDLSQLRYGKVIILADADSDGLHIATLLCALFMKHFGYLVEHGHIYVAMPPLYRIDVGKEKYYALDEQERDEIITRQEDSKKNPKISVTRFKGLGEMNPLQLRESTMHPDTRRLIQLKSSDYDVTNGLLDMLLAKKRAGDRKKWLETRGNLASV